MPQDGGRTSVFNGAAGASQATRRDQDGQPVLRIAAGRPSAEEIAAVVVAVLAARAARGGADRAAGRPRSEWPARARLLREPLPRGPGGWRASALPR
jgi:acyl-CoA carboxylase epsilon subunit